MALRGRFRHQAPAGRYSSDANICILLPFTYLQAN
jgi:hypothetical protein